MHTIMVMAGGPRPRDGRRQHDAGRTQGEAGSGRHPTPTPPPPGAIDRTRRRGLIRPDECLHQPRPKPLHTTPLQAMSDLKEFIRGVLIAIACLIAMSVLVIIVSVIISAMF
jgi:hypothetical protein